MCFSQVGGSDVMVHEIAKPYINKENNCLYCAVGNVLIWNGFQKENLDLMFDTQLNFYYGRYGCVDKVFPDNFILEKAPLKQRLIETLEPYNIDVIWHEGESYYDTWEKNCRIVKSRPIVLALDHFMLPYHESYHKEHGSHFVTMLGAQKEDAYVLDSVKMFTYKGAIKKEILEKSRNIQLNYSTLNNVWIDFRLKDNFKRIIDKNTMKNVLENVVWQMREKESSQNQFYGLRALAEFQKDMKLFESNAEKVEELLKDSEGNFFISMDNTFVSLLRVAQQRQVFAEYVSQIVGEFFPLYSHMAKDIYEVYYELNQSWLSVRNALYISLRRRKTTLFPIINEEMEKIIFKETLAVKQVEELLNLL